jgi:hypothetical protein
VVAGGGLNAATPARQAADAAASAAAGIASPTPSASEGSSDGWACNPLAEHRWFCPWVRPACPLPPSLSRPPTGSQVAVGHVQDPLSAAVATALTSLYTAVFDVADASVFSSRGAEAAGDSGSPRGAGSAGAVQPRGEPPAAARALDTSPGSKAHIPGWLALALVVHAGIASGV